MLLLTATTHTLELVTSSTSAIDYAISYADITSSAFTPDSVQGAISSATTTTILAAPASSTQRQVKLMTIVNKGTANQVLTLQKDVSATNYELLPEVTLAANETLVYTDGIGFSVLDVQGRPKNSVASNSGVAGRAYEFYKIGTATEAAAVRYLWSKDSGNPGAWAVGTPGLNGRTTDGTTTTDAGCIPFWTPTGSIYLTGFDISATVACQVSLIDILWVNSGAVVTTTTGQGITSPTLPARDVNGSTNGEGVYAAILVTAATTNAGAVTNMTLTYTNSDDTGSRTATMASFPATAVVGTVVPFQLQAGDRGIRSIQTLTLGTSLVTGSVSVVLFRSVAAAQCLLANVGATSSMSVSQTPGVRLYNGSCLFPMQLPSATTATTVSGVVTFMER